MSEILSRTVFETCLFDQTEAPWEEEVRMILAHDTALRLAHDTALRLALDTATRERDEWRRHAEEQLADVLRLRFLGIEFASQYGDRALACKYDNSCDDSGREPACIPCAFRYALGLMGVN